MPDEQTQQSQQNDERTSRLINYLGELWQRPHQPSAENLKRITAFVVGLPEEYREVGLRVIAQHLVNNMSLHYLEILATFEQGAEQEGIDVEEREGTLADVMPDFLTMMGLSDKVSVQSIDELVNLSNITIGWYRPSQVASAGQAQRWMYRLPKVYLEQIKQEHLMEDAQAQLPELHDPITRLSGFISLENSSSDSMQTSVASNKTLPKSAA